MSTDAAVRETDNDAAVSRLSAVNAGYLDDPFATFFVKRAQARPPLINVGTFLRTWGIDSLVRQFLESGPPGQKKQVVSLGAGTDTRFFRIMTSGTPPQGAPRDESENQRASGQTRVRPSFSTADLHKYVEVDFAEATSKKAMAIKKQAKLSALLGDDVKLEQGGTGLTSSKYVLLPGDLRDFQNSVASKLLEHLDTTVPTLLLAECVFIYIDTIHSNSILHWFADVFRQAGCMSILYDPVGLDDPFGKVMISNLKSRGLSLNGLPMSTSLEVQVARLKQCGFQECCARSMREIRRADVPNSEAERISKLELLDEVEELDLLLSHYSIAWAYSQPAQGRLFDEMRIGAPAA